MIFVYVFLILLLAPSIMYIVNKFSKNSLQELNVFEKIAFGSISSFLVFSIYLFILGMVGVEYNQYSILIPLALNIIFLLILFILEKPKLNFKIRKMEINKETVVTAILLITVITYLIYLVSKSISNFLLYPDEFSVWALNAKNIFLGRRMDYFINTGLENYPNFLPLLYSGFYFLIDKIDESSIRLFSSIYMIMCTIGLAGIVKRKKLNMSYMLIFILFVFITYGAYTDITSSAYGDIPFLTTYTLGTLYLIEWLAVERKKTYLIISSANLMSCCFMKTDGLYLMAFTVFLFGIFCFFSKWLKVEKVSVKQAVFFNASILWLPILWKVYNKLAGFPTNLSAGAGSVFELHLEYSISLFQNMTLQFYDCLPWALVLIILLAGYIFIFHKLEREDRIYINLCVLAIIANVVFLVFCYLFVFAGEAIIAASFIRYMTRAIMIAMIAVLIILKPLSRGETDNYEKENSKSNKIKKS